MITTERVLNHLRTITSSHAKISLHASYRHPGRVDMIATYPDGEKIHKVASPTSAYTAAADCVADWVEHLLRSSGDTLADWLATLATIPEHTLSSLKPAARRSIARLKARHERGGRKRRARVVIPDVVLVPAAAPSTQATPVKPATLPQPTPPAKTPDDDEPPYDRPRVNSLAVVKILPGFPADLIIPALRGFDRYPTEEERETVQALSKSPEFLRELTDGLELHAWRANGRPSLDMEIRHFPRNLQSAKPPVVYTYHHPDTSHFELSHFFTSPAALLMQAWEDQNGEIDWELE